MGVETVTTMTITCDNPACPGNSLDPSDYAGWVQLSAVITPVQDPESYTFPISSQAIYCSSACAGTVGQALEDAEDARNAPAAEEAAAEEEAPEPKKATRSRAKK